MANYYTHFSTMMRLPAEGVEEALRVHRLCREASDEMSDDLDPIPECLHCYIQDGDWSFDADSINGDAESLWLSDNAGGANIPAVAEFIRWLLEQYDDRGIVPLSFAHTCSKPRPDEFGGGACVITATEIRWCSVHQWVDDTVEQIKQERNN
jgi:hypothetical protein